MSFRLLCFRCVNKMLKETQQTFQFISGSACELYNMEVNIFSCIFNVIAESNQNDMQAEHHEHAYPYSLTLFPFGFTHKVCQITFEH